MNSNLNLKKDRRKSNLRLVLWMFALGCFYLFSCEAIYAYEKLIDPADKLEREMYQKKVQEELTHTPEQTKIREEKGMRFKPFKGCLVIKSVKIIGNKLLRNLLLKKDKKNILLLKKDKKNIVPYLNRCINATELNDLVVKLNTILFDTGYITARIEVDMYDKKSSELTLKIKEGRIEKIETTRLNYYTIFPGLTGNLLRIENLDQGIEQLNRLPSQSSVITLWPGKEVGGTIVKVDTKKVSKPYRLYLSFDNTGAKQTGRNVLKGNFSYDNLLSLNDQSFLAGSKSGLGRDRSVAVTWKEEVPLGYYTLGYGGSYSDSQYDIYPEDKETQLATNSLKNKLNLSKTIYRHENHKVSLDTSCWYYLPHQEIGKTHPREMWQQKLSVFEIIAQHEFYYPAFRILTELNYAQGVKLFGANENLFGKSMYSQRRYKLTSDYLWKVADKVHLNGNLQLQYAAHKLHGTMKLPVLDETSGVRGSKTNTFTLDDGAILRHDIVFPLFLSSISSNKIIKEAMVSPFLHGDLGWGKDKGDESMRFCSIGGGIKVNLFGFNGQITASRVLCKPSNMNENSWIVLFGLSQKIL
jgi:hemolysin activation/secretion protein